MVSVLGSHQIIIRLVEQCYDRLKNADEQEFSNQSNDANIIPDDNPIIAATNNATSDAEAATYTQNEQNERMYKLVTFISEQNDLINQGRNFFKQVASNTSSESTNKKSSQKTSHNELKPN